MTTQIPFSITGLDHHMASCPPAFLAEPRLKNGAGIVNVGAVAADVIRSIVGRRDINPDLADVLNIAGARQRNQQRLILLTCWLLAHEVFHNQPVLYKPARKLLLKELKPRAREVDARRFVDDDDRREELIRYVLNYFSLRPANETEAEAQDRLAALDSVENKRILALAEQRARQDEAARKKLTAEKRRAEIKAAAKLNRE